MARDLYDDHFKAVESMPRGVVVTLRNIATQLESSWELHTNRQVCQALLFSDFLKAVFVCCAYMYMSVHCTCVWCPQRSEGIITQKP